MSKITNDGLTRSGVVQWEPSFVSRRRRQPDSHNSATIHTNDTSRDEKFYFRSFSEHCLQLPRTLKQTCTRQLYV